MRAFSDICLPINCWSSGIWYEIHLRSYWQYLSLPFQILGFDSLEILPLFAIIILSFRKESIMQVASLDSIEAILADLSSIKVLPLVQLALSRD